MGALGTASFRDRGDSGNWGTGFRRQGNVRASRQWIDQCRCNISSRGLSASTQPFLLFLYCSEQSEMAVMRGTIPTESTLLLRRFISLFQYLGFDSAEINFPTRSPNNPHLPTAGSLTKACPFANEQGGEQKYVHTAVTSSMRMRSPSNATSNPVTYPSAQ
jgi:hypothetical protein